MRCGIIGIGALLATAIGAAADEPRDARRAERALQAVIAKAEPAVACLFVYRPENSAAPDSFRGLNRPDAVPDYYASGVVLDPSGKILTNYHFLRAAAGEGQDPNRLRIRVRLCSPRDAAGDDAGPWEGTAAIFAADAKSDLAVLKLEGGRASFPVVPLGRGEDLKKGSTVVALGHPFAAGLRDGSPSASAGIVSNLRRRPTSVGTEFDRAKQPLSQFGTLLQTDVRLQLGASGGALLDLDGKLVGLTTAQAALTGVDAPGGFAIPMDETTRRIVDVLRRGEEVEYGFLGINTAPDFGHRLAPGTGVRIGEVVGNTPAADSLRPGDVILKINGRPIREYDELFFGLSATLAGHTASLHIRRYDDEKVIDVTLVKAQIGDLDRTTHRLKDEFAVIAKTRPREWHGLRVEYTSVLGRDGAVIPAGVLVREVTGPAKSAGLRPYEDIIIRLNGELVNSPAQFHEKAGRAASVGSPLTLTLAGNRTVTLP